MFDDTGSMFESGRDAASIQLDVGHRSWRGAAELLVALGGYRRHAEDGVGYWFFTQVARDDALELVRNQYGGTVADPHDGRQVFRASAHRPPGLADVWRS